MKKIILALILFLWLMCEKCYAAEGTAYDTAAINSQSNELIGIGFDDIYNSIAKGDNVGQLIWQSIKERLIYEPIERLGFIKGIFALSLVSGIISVIARDIGDNGIADLIEYICRLCVGTAAISGLGAVIGIMLQSIESITELINSAMPLIAGLLTAGGRAAQASTVGIFFTMMTDILAELTERITAPLIMLSSLTAMINNLSERRLITKLAELFKWATGLIIKGGAMLFIYLISMERITGGILNKAVSGTAKTAIGAVPVIGNTLKSGADAIENTAAVLGGGAGAAISVILIVLCAVPLIRIGVIVLLYKAAAAVIEPICDKELAVITDSIAEGCRLCFAALFAVMLMFTAGVLITLAGLS